MGIEGLFGAGASLSVGRSKTFSYRTELDKKGHKRKLTKTGHTETMDSEFSLTLPGDFGITVGYSWSKIEGDANADNDGEYLSITLEPSIPIPGFTTAVQILGTAINDALRQPPGSSIRERLAVLVKNMKISAVGAGMDEIEAGASVTFAYIMDDTTKKWDLMYTRFSKTRKFEQEFDLKAWALPGLEVGAKAGVSLSQESAMGEILGPNLAYLRSVYNGFLNRGTRGRMQWDTYKKAQRAGLVQTVVASGTPGTSAHGEAKAFDPAKIDTKKLGEKRATREEEFEMKDLAGRLARAKQYFPACEAAKQAGKEQDPATLEELLKLLDDYMWAYRLLSTQEDAAKWLSASQIGAEIEVRMARPTARLTKAVKGEDMAELDTLGKAIDHNYRVKLKLNVADGRRTRHLELALSGPIEEARKEFRSEVKGKFKSYKDFPGNLAMLDEQLHGVWMSFARKVEDVQSGAKADKSRDAQWGSAMETRLDAVLDRLLAAPLER